MSNYTTFEEQVNYGLEQIDSERTVEMKLKDIVFLHQMVGEMIDFFQQPRHYPDVDDVHQLMGDNDQGALRMMKEAYTTILQDALPADIHQEFAENETFDNPNPPYYNLDY